MKHIKSILYLVLFTASPVLMILGVLAAFESFPDVPLYAAVMFAVGFLLHLANKKLEHGFAENTRKLEYDEFGRRKGMEDSSRMSKRERIQLDKQRVSDMERIVSSAALERMTKPGSKNPDADMEKLIGMEPVKAQMGVMAARMEYDSKLKKKQKKGYEEPSRHMVFIGSPGTGKTTVARIMTGFLYKNGFVKYNRCLETDGNFMKASTAADTAAKVSVIIRKAFGGVLFIDEAYALLDGNDAGKAAIATLIKEMEDNRGRFVLIIAGYTDEMKQLIQSNPGFASRFKDCIEFPDYTGTELEEIFTSMVNGKGLCIGQGAMEAFRLRISQERKSGSFGNARTARNIMEESIDRHAYNLKTGKIPEGDRYRLTGMDVSARAAEKQFWDIP